VVKNVKRTFQRHVIVCYILEVTQL